MVVSPPVFVAAPASPQLMIEDSVADGRGDTEVKQKRSNATTGGACNRVAPATTPPHVYRNVSPSAPGMTHIGITAELGELTFYPMNYG
jgi:hypothetical protein